MTKQDLINEIVSLLSHADIELIYAVRSVIIRFKERRE